MMRVSWLARMLALAFTAQFAHAGSNALPPEAQQALHSPGHAVLYSLEPWEDLHKKVARFHGYEILGQSELTPTQESSAVAAFDAAIAGFDGTIAACFDPRHAIRIQSNGHNYDFLLCYSCHQLKLYRDDKSLAGVGVVGSPKALNDLMASLHLPLSHSLEDMEASKKAEAARNQEGMKRFLAAMPKSMHRYWESMQYYMQGQPDKDPDLAEINAALKTEFSEPRERARVLLTWYGSGSSRWSGYPAYEEVVEKMIEDIPTTEIIDLLNSGNPSEPELEGAARYLGDWGFSQRLPDDLSFVPAQIKARLLEHTLHTGDQRMMIGANVPCTRSEPSERSNFRMTAPSTNLQHQLKPQQRAMTPSTTHPSA